MKSLICVSLQEKSYSSPLLPTGSQVPWLKHLMLGCYSLSVKRFNKKHGYQENQSSSHPWILHLTELSFLHSQIWVQLSFGLGCEGWYHFRSVLTPLVWELWRNPGKEEEHETNPGFCAHISNRSSNHRKVRQRSSLPFYPNSLFFLNLPDPKSIKQNTKWGFRLSTHRLVLCCVGVWPTFPNVLSDSPDFLRNWAASPADIFPVFPGSSFKESHTQD